MQTEVQRPDIFEYWDHIKILNDLFDYKKKLNPRISLERVARDSKVFKRPLLSLVFAGRRTLQEEKIAPLVRALGMTKQESLFFQALVQFNQSKNPNESSAHLSEVLVRKPMSTSLEGDRNILLTKWYYIPILELIKIPGFNPSLKWIELRFRKKISTSEIDEALKLLQSLKLVSVVDDLWTVNDKTLATSQDIPSKAIQAYHHSSLEMSGRALSDTPLNEREFLGVTFPVSRSEVETIKEELRKLCRKIVLGRPPEAQHEEVASLNIQFYFLTQKQGD